VEQLGDCQRASVVEGLVRKIKEDNLHNAQIDLLLLKSAVPL